MGIGIHNGIPISIPLLWLFSCPTVKLKVEHFHYLKHTTFTLFHRMDNVFETAEMMMQGMEIDEEFVKHIKQGLHGVKELMDVFSQYSSAKGLLKQKK